MSAQASRPPAFDARGSGTYQAALPQPRAKSLTISQDAVDRHVEHMRSGPRADGRKRSRELLRQGLTETRCLACDFAEALDIDERGAGKAITGERPVDIGDLIALGRGGRGCLRTARRLIALLSAELDRVEAASSGHE